ncbi:hypothetical protein MLD38_005873 [Melastoma candidum]|uniref:Uncharacterized protein n=1 Tax=Melastoma candidum TaxID=119954 RepID=A0ACB9RLM9_9MYRT|nr:hypothetical protein MLD38_005873 [Melastoma candidum]
MPRTTTLECSGCPPLRALTFDVLGLIKVVEARDKPGEGCVPKVVDRWGDPDSSRCVLAASIDDRSSRPLLAVARSSGKIDLMNPLNGQSHAEISIGEDGRNDDDPVVGLHLFRKTRTEKSRSYTIFTCTTKGNAIIQSYEVADSIEEASSSNKWNVCSMGSISFCKVEANEEYAVVGGKGVEISVWNLEKCLRIWNAKSPPKDSLGIFSPTWFTCGTFLCKDDHRKIVAGTNNHQVRLYDISAQRRPVISFDFRETPIKAVGEDLDGHTVYVGNGSGDLASFDMRTGKLVGGFTGKCSGSIRSIVRHPNLPVVASCGLDRYLRLWDVKSRQLLSAVFLKQHLNGVLFDSNFSCEEPTQPAPDPPVQEAHGTTVVTSSDDDEVTETKKRKKVRVDENGDKKGKSRDKSGKSTRKRRGVPKE